MIANLLNTILGLWLVYVAVLDPAWDEPSWKLPVASVLVLVFAFWARASDLRRWQSSVNVVLGVILLILAALHWGDLLTPLVMFWGVFWPGVLVAIIALWSAARPSSVHRRARPTFRSAWTEWTNISARDVPCRRTARA